MCDSFRSNQTKSSPSRFPREELPSPQEVWCTAGTLQSQKGLAVKVLSPLASHAICIFLIQQPSFLGLFIRGSELKSLSVTSQSLFMGRYWGNHKSTFLPLCLTQYLVLFPNQPFPHLFLTPEHIKVCGSFLSRDPSKMR